MQAFFVFYETSFGRRSVAVCLALQSVMFIGPEIFRSQDRCGSRTYIDEHRVWVSLKTYIRD
jgi:hypothetical protein